MPESQSRVPSPTLCIFLLTTLHEYLNILCVSTQRYNSLGFESEIGSKATKSSKEGIQLMATKKKAAKKKKKK
jgi:hypothetical protein